VGLRATTLTATSPSTADAGTALTVRGGLTSGSAPVVGAPVQVTRLGCSSTPWSAAGLTAGDGTWSLVDAAPPAGTCTYRASYAGSGTYASSSQSTSTVVALRDAGVTVAVVRGTGSAKKSVTVTGRLGGWHVNRTLTITAQPSGGAETVLASGTVDSAGTFTAAFTPRTTTTYRVKYTGDDWYAAATATRTQ
jgi:hypothetical protein